MKKNKDEENCAQEGFEAFIEDVKGMGWTSVAEAIESLPQSTKDFIVDASFKFSGADCSMFDGAPPNNIPNGVSDRKIERE